MAVMVFSSIPFLFFFLPACFALYYPLPFRWKNHVLLLFSLVFYAWGEPVYLFLMLFSAFVNFVGGICMDRWGQDAARRKIFLAVPIAVNLSLLLFFKYADFLAGTLNDIFRLGIPKPGIPLPIGISFFTFQTMSYSIDLYHRKVPVERNYLTYLTYVSMFPQLIAGPIVRFSTVQKELHERSISRWKYAAGLRRFLFGLYKKVLLANSIGALWEEIRLLMETQGGLALVTAWFGAFCFTLQLYFDFSAYSDMAIGLGEMLGFHFLENFRYPLAAVSISDFWRRWHISLGTWFRDYVYIPLGGNRVSTAKHIRNILIVWFLTGLWHGAAWNFVLWGLYYGMLLLLEKYVWGRRLAKAPGFARHLYTVVLVVLGFAIFVFDDMTALSAYIRCMFPLGGNPLVEPILFWYLRDNAILLLFGIIFAFPVVPALSAAFLVLRKNPLVFVPLFRAAFAVPIHIFLFLLSVASLVNEGYNPFLYFRF